MFTDDVVLRGCNAVDMTEYLELWKKALKEREMRVNRLKAQLVDGMWVTV